MGLIYVGSPNACWLAYITLLSGWVIREMLISSMFLFSSSLRSFWTFSFHYIQMQNSVQVYFFHFDIKWDRLRGDICTMLDSAGTESMGTKSEPCGPVLVLNPPPGIVYGHIQNLSIVAVSISPYVCLIPIQLRVWRGAVWLNWRRQPMEFTALLLPASLFPIMSFCFQSGEKKLLIGYTRLKKVKPWQESEGRQADFYPRSTRAENHNWIKE